MAADRSGDALSDACGLDGASEPLLSGVLANGLGYVCASRPGTRTVYAELTVKAGLRHEPEGQNGVAHMVEHVVGRQTAKYDDPGFRRATDCIGAQLNAGVKWEWTSYHVTALAPYLEESLDLLREMVAYSRILPADVETQRRIVLEEIAQTADSPDMLLLQRVAAALYPDHPLGRPICGTPESVASLTLGQIEQFYRRHYLPNNAVVTLVGDCDSDRLCAAAEHAFAGWAAGPVPDIVGEVTERMLLNQAVVVVAVPVVGEADPDSPAIELLAWVLGGGPGSPLWETLRESRGLAYRLGCIHRAISDAGFVVAYCGVKRQNVDLAVAEMKEVLTSRPVELGTDRVRGAIAGLLTRFALETQTNAGYGAYLARHAASGDVSAGRRRWALLATATPEALEAVRARHLRPERCVVAKVLPLRGLSGLAGGLRMLWRVRHR